MKLNMFSRRNVSLLFTENVSKNLSRIVRHASNFTHIVSISPSPSSISSIILLKEKSFGCSNLREFNAFVTKKYISNGVPCFPSTKFYDPSKRPKSRNFITFERIYSVKNSKLKRSKNFLSSETFKWQKRNAQIIREMDPMKYHEVSSKVFDIIQDRLEEEDMLLPDGSEVDVEYSDGVLTFSADDVGVWVINKHLASKQIWLSSPLTGPSKFYFDETKNIFVNERAENENLKSVLEKEISDTLHIPNFSFSGDF